MNPRTTFPADRRPNARRDWRIGGRLRATDWQSYAPLCASLAAFAMMMIPLLGVVAVLAFLGFGGLIFLLRPVRSLANIARFWPLLLFPLLAIVSTIWSDAPHVTMRAAVQLMISIVFTVVIASTTSARALLRVLFCGSTLLCLSALPNLQRAIALGIPLTSNQLGSKNQIGFAGYVLFASAWAIAIDRGQARSFRLASVTLIPLALVFVYLSKSGGGTVSILLTVLMFPLFYLLAGMRQQTRVIATGAGLLTLLIAFLFRETINNFIAAFRTDVLEKNESLTGRTYLWNTADRIWSQRPLLGHGFSSFWRHGNIEAEALWRWGGIASRSGFNFHNMFVETKVDLGVVGLALLVALCAAILVSSLWRQLRRPNRPFAFFVVAICVLYFRATVEDGLIAQFSLSTLILFAAAVHSRLIEPTLPQPRGRALSPIRRQRLWRQPSVNSARPRSSVGYRR